MNSSATAMQYGSVDGVKKPVSRMVLGTMVVTTGHMENGFRLLDAAMEAGINTFDTAHVYGNGDCERAFGQWMKDRGVRGQIVIIGKGAHHNEDRKRVTPYDITSDLHDSLARMQTDYIDIYLLHRDNPEVPAGPLVEILNEHQRSGLIHSFGGSNWSHERIAQANEYAAGKGLTPFTSSSPNFCLPVQKEMLWEGCAALNGEENKPAFEWYKENRMPVFAWSSLGSGFMSGRITRESYEANPDAFDPCFRRAFCHEENFQRLDRARQMAEEKGVTLPQLALAYVLSQPLDIHALVGAAKEEEIRENLHAFELDLSEEERAWLNLERETKP